MVFTGKPVCLGVVGLPRFGTTLTGSVLDSIDNAFCLIEPIWTSISSGQQRLRCKLGEIDLQPTENIIPYIKKAIGEKYALGSIKETYRVDQLFCVKPVIDNSDKLLFVLREPLSTFDSWKRLSWSANYTDASYFVRNYIAYYNTFKEVSNEKPTTVIVHEKLCTDGMPYLNAVFDNKIKGDFVLKKMPYGEVFGDGKAKDSEVIEPPTLSHSRVSKSEERYILRNVSSIYQQLSNYKSVIFSIIVIFSLLFALKDVGKHKIDGYLYVDQNHNQIYDSGDTALANTLVFIDENNNGVIDPGETYTVTDSVGHFTLPDCDVKKLKAVLPKNHQINSKTEHYNIGVVKNEPVDD